MRYLDMLLPMDPSTANDHWTWGTVTSGAPLQIKLDGEDQALAGVPQSLTAKLRVGDRVWVQLHGRQLVIHGRGEAAVSGWYPLTWESGSLVTDYGTAGWTGPAVIRSTAGIIKLRGLGRITAGSVPASGTVILILPPGYRPAYRMKFVGLGGTNTTGITYDLTTDGRLSIQSPPAPVAGYVNMDQIAFPAADVAPVEAWTPIDFTGSDGWTQYSTTDPNWAYPPGYWQDRHGRVWFVGLVKRSGAASGDSLMFQLPMSLAPKATVHGLVAANTASGAGAVSWGADARVLYKNTPTDAWRWMSLSNIWLHPVAAIPEGLWKDLTYAGAWRSYGGSYSNAGVWVAEDGYAHTRGMLAAGATGAITTALPTNAQTDHNVMMLTSAINLPSRVDQSGGIGDYTLKAVAGTSTQWTNLVGMFVPVAMTV
jgi:hypothetical protein